MERGRMAPSFFLIVHDEFTGRPRIGRDLLLCGLVGAQLADLVIDGHLTMTGDRVTVTGPGASALDERGILVVDGVAHERDTRTVRAWTDALGARLHDRIVDRLTADRVLRRETGRGLFGLRRERYPAVDLVRARRPRVELQEMFGDPRRFDLSGAFVASLLTTLGLDTVLEPEVDRTQVRSISAQAAEHLPGSLSRLRAGLADAATGPTTRR